jgi:membrane protein
VPVSIIMFITAKTIFFLHEGRRSIEYQMTFALFLWAFLFVLYKFIPEVRVKSWVAALSAAVSGVALFVLQKTFLWVSLRVFSQNKIYGSLASFPIFLLWLLAVWYVVLLGVSLCAFLQQKGAKSS